jgi:CBS domain containing-hemolysin-like protein
MTHRTEIFSLDRQSRAEAALPPIFDSGYSRIPVYGRDPEHIVGVVFAKEVARMVVEGHGDTLLRDLMVDPIYVPPNRTIHQLMRRLRRERLNLAIVLDEYGGIRGLVTMEDIVEEFVGEIYDEDEEVGSEPLVVVGENEFSIQGDAPIYVVNDQLDVTIPYEGDARTIGGYLTELLGRIPVSGERLNTPIGTFTIESVRRNSIVKVRLRKAAPSAD